MTADQLTERLFDLSECLHSKAQDLLLSEERTRDEFVIGLTLEFISQQIVEVFSDAIETKGSA